MRSEIGKHKLRFYKHAFKNASVLYSRPILLCVASKLKKRYVPNRAAFYFGKSEIGFG